MREKFLGTALIIEAMKGGEAMKMRLQVLKNLKSDIVKEEGGKKEMTDTEIINKIRKSIEGLEETIKFYNQDTIDRTDAIAEANEEIAVLQSFMPEMMSETEIETAVDEILAETGVTDMKGMGRVMGAFTKQYTGKADNGIASQIIKSKLQ